LVEVPITVTTPPSVAANAIGISTTAGLSPWRGAHRRRGAISKATTAVLFMKVEIRPVPSSSLNREA